MTRRMGLFVAALMWIGTGCGATAGQELNLEMVFQGMGPGAGMPRLLPPGEGGWQVTLTQAQVVVGPLYVSAVPVPVEDEHSASVLVEWLDQAVVDLLDPTPQAVPTRAHGLTGHGVNVELGLTPLVPGTSPTDRRMSSAVVSVIGTANRGATSVPFTARVTLTSLRDMPTWSRAQQARVKAAAADIHLGPASRRLSVQIDVAPWFYAIDFAAPEFVAAGGSAVALPAAAIDQLWQGMQAEAGVYTFLLSP